MNILIVSATTMEIDPLLSQFNFQKDSSNYLKNYSYRTHRIDVLITGIGMTSTAFWLGKTLSSNKYDAVINLGLAGSFEDTIVVGDTVQVISDQFSELGAEDGDSFLSLKEMNLSEEAIFTNGVLKNSYSIKNSIIDAIPKVKGITVNTTHGNEQSIQKVRELHHPQTESMEGAAFLYACLMEKVTCAQIRTISNKVERRNKDNWDIPLAVKNLCTNGLEIINSL